jgi:hypothetical protein
VRGGRAFAFVPRAQFSGRRKRELKEASPGGETSFDGALAAKRYGFTQRLTEVSGALPLCIGEGGTVTRRTGLSILQAAAPRRLSTKGEVIDERLTPSEPVRVDTEPAALRPKDFVAFRMCPAL